MATWQERIPIAAWDRVSEADHAFADEHSLARSRASQREGFFAGLLAAMHELRRCQAACEIRALDHLVRQARAEETREFVESLARRHRQVEAQAQASRLSGRDTPADANFIWRVWLHIAGLVGGLRAVRNGGPQL